MKIKHLLNVYTPKNFIPLLLLLLFYSCEKEPDFENKGKNASTISNIQAKSGSFSDFSNDPLFQKAYSALEKNGLNTSLELNARGSTKYLHGIKIDTSFINKVRYNSGTSYTFFVLPEKPSKNFYENLVVQMDTKENVWISLIKHTPEKPGSHSEQLEVGPVNWDFEESLQDVPCVWVVTTEATHYLDENGNIYETTYNDVWTLVCDEEYTGEPYTPLDPMNNYWNNNVPTGPAGPPGESTSTNGGGYGTVSTFPINAFDEFTNSLRGKLKLCYQGKIPESDKQSINYFLLDKGFSPQVQEAAKNALEQVCGNPNLMGNLSFDFLNILLEIPDAKLDRYTELKDKIEQNPWALIQDCAQQNGMDTQDYIDLYNHEIPQSCKDRLNTLNQITPGYFNQPISDGNVPLANIDYYGVEITTYPDFDNDGNPDTEAEIYQAFREKFTDLASGEKDDFQFSCDIPFNPTNTGDISWEFTPLIPQDGDDFVSNDPIASILLIEAEASDFLPSIATDDGAIIVSDFTNNDWTISTISTPGNGTQPFSGNRQWGWLINQNGNLEFFTRAVDVANISTLLNISSFGAANTECQQETYYDIAKASWQNLQEEIKDWIENDGGGQATVNTPNSVHVKKETIEEVLTTNESIDQILSNCN